MEKTIKIGNKEVKMKATASTPKRYRNMFNRDLLVELQKIASHIDVNTGAFIGEVDFDVVENLAYIMAKQADDGIAEIEDWLDMFEPTDVYNAIPQILSVWNNSQETLSTPKRSTKEKNG